MLTCLTERIEAAIFDTPPARIVGEERKDVLPARILANYCAGVFLLFRGFPFRFTECGLSEQKKNAYL
jgi:hypothetical protein